MGVKRNVTVAKKDHWALLTVLLLFFCLAAIYGTVTPIFEGFDEPWHYAYVDHIAAGKGLPRQPPDEYPHLAGQEASQPPLYYLLASAVTRWIPGRDLAAQLHKNPQFAPIPWGYRDNQNFVIHTRAEGFPYHGTTLAVHLARLLSILLGLGTVCCTYILARLLFPGETVLAFGATLVTALTPSFLFCSALVNNDALVTFLSSVTLVLLVKLWKEQSSTRTALVLGLVLGFAALAKLSGLFLWLFAGVMLVVLAWRRQDLRLLVRLAVPAFMLAILISGWWYIRNWTLYGEPTGISAMLGVIGSREPGFNLVDVWAEFAGIRWSFWALFGWFNVSVPNWLYRVYDTVSMLALIGLVGYMVRAVRRRNWPGLLGVLFTLSWLLVVAGALVRWTLMTPASQGRLLFPAISATSILLMRGWLTLLPKRINVQTWAVVAVMAAFLAVAVYVPFWVIAPVYAAPMPLSLERVRAQVSVPLDVRFEEGVALLGYRIDPEEVDSGDLLWVTACWQGERQLAEDYFVFVQLLVDNELIAAQKDTYHGLGGYPTSQWSGSEAFCDRYPLRVADTVPATSQGELAIGLYRQDRERLLAWTHDGEVIGDNVRFAGPLVKVSEDRVLEYGWGHKIALVDYELGDTAVAAGDSLTLTLLWRGLQPMAADYVATVQILDHQSTKIGQSDIALNTASWQPNFLFEDHRTIQIAQDAAHGVYRINVGLYDPATVENLALYRKQLVQPGGGLLTIWTLRVVPPGP